MEIAPVSLSGGQPQTSPPVAEKVEKTRQESNLALAEPKKAEAATVQEEILNKIKMLTEDGLYSVRFEKHPAINALVIKLVDQEGEVIRQIPAEEILNLSERLDDLRGKVIKAKS